MTEAYYARLWEDDFRARLKRGAWIGCDHDWRRAPYPGCRCFACRLVSALTLLSPSSEADRG